MTLDEVFWKAKRNRGIEKAMEAAEAMLNFPNLEKMYRQGCSSLSYADLQGIPFGAKIRYSCHDSYS